MSKPFIYEFLYRGGDDAKPDDDTWQVQIAQWVDNPVTGGKYLQVGPMMGPDEAAAAGYPLTKILPRLNARAVEGAVELRRQRDAAVDAKEVAEEAASLAKASRK